MFVFCDPAIHCGWIPHAFEPPQVHGIFIAKVVYKLVPNGVASALDDDSLALLSGNVFFDDNPNQGLAYASDFVPVKVRPDLLLIATAHAPQGRPMQSFEAAWHVGSWQKRIKIVGDRKWTSTPLSMVASEPGFLSTLPIRYTNSFGGPTSSRNPIGKGFGLDSRDLPNLELPSDAIANPGSKVEAAGFGPLSENWMSRRVHVGTYDDLWKKSRWPWYPQDFDYRYFNSAPVDQQLSDFLVGDESLFFENLHPEYSKFQTRLPGQRIRCFVGEENWRQSFSKETFREVSLRLDTLHINLEQEVATLVWRGSMPIRSIAMSEIESVFFIDICQEPNSSLQLCYQCCLTRMESLEEADNSGETETTDISEDAQRDADAFDKELEDITKQADEFEEQATREAIAKGIDPAVFEKGQASSISDVRASALQAAELLSVSSPAAAAEYQDFANELLELESLLLEQSQLETPPLTREDVIAKAARGESFADCNLSNLELFELKLDGLDFRGANLSECILDGASFNYANLSNCDLTGADLTDASFDHACLDGADFTDAILEGAVLTNTSIAEAVFSKLSLSGLNFSGSSGIAPDFSESELSQANFSKALIPQANFTGATLTEANFSKASLVSSQFEGVKAKGIIFDCADISGLHGSDKSDFSFGRFRSTTAVGSIWDDSNLDHADFSESRLENALFSNSSLKRTNFFRSDLSRAVLDDADLSESILEQCNLRQASLDRARLFRAKLRGSNLYNAGFWEADLTEADLYQANTKGTSLST
jgi:uncharacterized protein YjbI with pentapeptide repeats